MAKIKVRVRPGNYYRVSRDEQYGPGDEFEVDEGELLAVPHCLISSAEDLVAKAAHAEAELSKSQQSNAVFEAAREAARQSAQEAIKARARAQEIQAEQRSKATELVNEQLEQLKAPKSKKSDK